MPQVPLRPQGKAAIPWRLTRCRPQGGPRRPGRGAEAAGRRLGPKFEIVNTLIEARTRAGLTQGEVAERMGTTQSVVARMEGGRTIPNLRSLHRYAEATGQRLKLTMERASG
nr:helix-turn-helix transcriptional regulator [Thioalkalivibrio thiocyanodenitrificans]